SAANNNTRGNTRESTTNLPDAEDINQDNTLNEAESYFQYEIPFVQSVIDPRGFDEEATPFITDRLEDQNSGRIWYRFRVPLNSDQRVAVGGIQDFRSIRFMRMYMTGFRAPTTLRFAEFELVRNSWRRYNRDFEDAPPSLGGEADAEFNIDAVNIEENSSRLPFNYVLPIGIRREQSLGVVNTLQNEQSLALRVQNFQPGDRRAVFKYTETDLRLYERLKMFVHAEALGESRLDEPEKGELNLFIRMGTDFESNYYEYEVPLRMSDTSIINRIPMPVSGATIENTADYAQEVWPIINEVDLPLTLLRDLKLERNNLNASTTEEYSTTFRPFEEREGLREFVDREAVLNAEHTLRVKGNPNLGFVKVFMIGVKRQNDLDNDGISAEVWVNELRLEGLDERGGVAGLARADIQLADLGSITGAINASSIGFGALDNSVTERARQSTFGYDLAGNFNLDRFFPQSLGLRLPLYLQHSKTVSTPEYDPYDLDIVLQDKLKAAENSLVQDSLREQAQEINKISAIALNDVSISPGGATGKSPLSPANLSLSYGVTKTERSDPFIANETIKDHTGGIDYTYSRGRGGSLEPFKGIKSKYLKLISEFNINPLPNSISVSNVLNKSFATTTYRFAGVDPEFNTFYNKRFTWDRLYDLRWDLTRSLKLGYNATMNATIDEVDENTILGLEESARQDARSEAIWDGLRNGGRPKLFTQGVNASYQLPLRYFPFLDFVDVRANYLGRYSWNASALSLRDSSPDSFFGDLGNTIQNSQTRSLTANLNFEKFYDQFKFLRGINRPQRRRPASRSRNTPQQGEEKEEGGQRTRRKKNDGPSAATRALIRPLLAIRSVRGNYSEDFETIIPGFTPEPSLFGQTDGFRAPGWGFVTGFQPTIRTLAEDRQGTSDDYLQELADGGYLSTSVFQAQDVVQTYTKTWDVSATIEPFTD
ncbi:MAG: cell surface protein SprA, partial [Bacteroidota bacterium]